MALTPATVGGMLTAIALAHASGCAAAASERRANVAPITVSVDDPRPVQKAAEELESRFGQIITYEDPAYEDPSEIADVTSQVRRDGATSPPVLVPRGGKIDIAYEDRPGAPASPRAVIEQVLEANARAGNPGVFRLEQAGDDFHVLPAKRRDRGGKLVAASSPLDAPVDVNATERTGLRAVEEIAGLVARSTGIAVNVGTVPVNLLQQHRTTLSASHESARSVLRRLLGELDRKVSWALLYDPGERAYALNLHMLARAGAP